MSRDKIFRVEFASGRFSGRALALFLALPCVRPAALSAAAPFRSAPAIAPAPVSDVLAQLPVLPPLRQIELIRQIPESDPLASDLAALIVSPEDIAARRAELEARLGAPQYSALMKSAVELHVEARSDERVMAAFEALARRIADSSGNADFDGAKPLGPLREAAAVEGARLSPAWVQPVGIDPDYRRRVHTLSAQDGELLIDGKPARRFGARETVDGLVKEAFIHPEDPGLLVKIYHSPASLAGFEYKSAKMEALLPLAAAGAAPRLIEHGEAPVDGKGRVYFYVQELVEGRTLKESPPGAAELVEAANLFKRLAGAGLALIVPGPSQDWLLSHVMIGRARGGDSRAYLLGGQAEPAQPEEARANYEMLLSLVSAAPARADHDPARSKPASNESSDEGKPLSALLRLLPAGAERDQVILKISGSAYAKMTNDEILSVLMLLSGGPSSAYAQVAQSAWRGLERADAQQLIKQALANPNQHPASGIAIEWMKARHAESGGAGSAREDFHELAKLLPQEAYLPLCVALWPIIVREMNGKDVYEALSRLGSSISRDSLILSLPGAVFETMGSAEISALLRMFGAYGDDTMTREYGLVPVEAWRGMERNDLNSLVHYWIHYKGTSSAIERLWTKANASSAGTDNEGSAAAADRAPSGS